MTENKRPVLKLKTRTMLSEGKMIGLGAVEDERWQQCYRYPDYDISIWGNVRRRRDGLCPPIRRQIKSGGYQTLRCSFLYQGKIRNITVAHEMCWTFIGVRPNAKMTTHHKDIDSSNNYYTNLEWATVSKQTREQSDRKDHKFVGIRKHRRKWRTLVGHSGSNVHIGCYDTPEEAARAYDKALIELGITDRQPNFPTSYSYQFS